MRALSLAEMEEISGGRFKFHFNIFQAVSTLALGFVTAGPAGVGMAICALVATQGLGQTHDMAVTELGMEPLQ